MVDYRSGRDQFNVGGNANIFIKNDGRPAPADTTDLGEAEVDPWRKWKWIAGAVTASLFLIGSLLPGNRVEDFPKASDVRPEGASDGTVLGPVERTLRDCAKAVVLKPANCPQGISDPYATRPSDVKWRLHGNPLDGARIVYTSQDRKFHVLGSIVMSVTYQGNGKPRFASQSLYFWARLTWSDNKAALDDVRHYDRTPNPAIEKHDPAVQRDKVSAALRQAFRRCIAAKTMPMPQECPNPTGSPAFSHDVEWTLEGGSARQRAARI